MKKYFIDEVICWNGGQIKGFYITVDPNTATLEIPGDIPGDKNLLYSEEIERTFLGYEVFSATYTDGTLVGPGDGEFLNAEVVASSNAWGIETTELTKIPLFNLVVDALVAKIEADTINETDRDILRYNPNLKKFVEEKLYIRKNGCPPPLSLDMESLGDSKKFGWEK